MTGFFGDQRTRLIESLNLAKYWRSALKLKEYSHDFAGVGAGPKHPPESVLERLPTKTNSVVGMRKLFLPLDKIKRRPTLEMNLMEISQLP